MHRVKLLGTIGLLLLGGALEGAAGAELEFSNAAVTKREQADELAVAFSSNDMMDRMRGIKTLSAMINRGGGLESSEIRVQLQSLRADPDPNVAFQAEVELARMDGIDLISPEVREAHRRSMVQEQAEESAVALSSEEMMDRMRGVKALSAMIKRGEGLESSEIRALLQTARADPDRNVAFQAEVELARMEGIDLISPEVRAAHRLSMEREQVDECEAALGSTQMMERMLAVKSLAAIADDAIEPVRVVSLLSAARSDPDWNVSEQARVALEAWSARWEN